MWVDSLAARTEAVRWVEGAAELQRVSLVAMPKVCLSGDRYGCGLLMTRALGLLRDHLGDAVEYSAYRPLAEMPNASSPSEKPSAREATTVPDTSLSSTAGSGFFMKPRRFQSVGLTDAAWTLISSSPSPGSGACPPRITSRLAHRSRASGLCGSPLLGSGIEAPQQLTARRLTISLDTLWRQIRSYRVDRAIEAAALVGGSRARRRYWGGAQSVSLQARSRYCGNRLTLCMCRAIAYT